MENKIGEGRIAQVFNENGIAVKKYTEGFHYDSIKRECDYANYAVWFI